MVVCKGRCESVDVSGCVVGVKGDAQKPESSRDVHSALSFEKGGTVPGVVRRNSKKVRSSFLLHLRRRPNQIQRFGYQAFGVPRDVPRTAEVLQYKPQSFGDHGQEHGIRPTASVEMSFVDGSLVKG